MDLDNIHSLEKLNQILNDTAAAGYDQAITASSWGSRDFTLISHKEGDPDNEGDKINAKMSDIINTFERLAKTDSDTHLVGNIHDRIFDLNAEGENKLRGKGPGAVLLRNIKTLFSRSHTTKNDNIELKYISTEEIKNKADNIIKKFDGLKKNIEVVVKKQNDSKTIANDVDRKIFETDGLDVSEDEIKEYEPTEPTQLNLDIFSEESLKKDYSTELIRNIFLESKDTNSAKCENTKNAIRYIAYQNPEKALDIIENLNSSLYEMLDNPVNPREFFKSVQDFLEVQKKEIYSTSKHLIPPHEGGGSSEAIDKPSISVSADDPVANIKAQFGDNFSIILDEETKKPLVQFKFETQEERQATHDALFDAIDRSSELSIYERPREDNLLPLGERFQGEKDGKYLQTLSPHATMLLSGVDGEHFMKNMFQAAWNQNNTPETQEERSKVLVGVIKNLTELEIKNFFRENDIDLDSDNFKKGSLYITLNEVHPRLVANLEEERKLKNGVKNFSMENMTASTMYIVDYINDKVKVIPFEEKLLLFIQHANPEAMDQLLANSDPKLLNTPIKISTDVTATPLEFALKKERMEIAEALIKAGATANNIMMDIYENVLKEQELQTEVKNFSIEKKGFEYIINYMTLSDLETMDYFNDKYKSIPIEKKLLIFIRHANPAAMDLLLKSISKNILDTPIKIDASSTATPLGFAMKEGKWNIFYSLYAAGARESVIQEDSKETRYSTQDYLKNKTMLEIKPE